MALIKHRKKAVFEDDGRVIAPMNIEGMPWYAPERQRRAESSNAPALYTLTRREKLAFMSGVLKATLLAAFVFIGFLLAFILFCTEIWLR